MPIFYNKELGGWETKDLSEEEKEALLSYAKEMIVDGLGAELAENILRAVQNHNMLGQIPKEEMGNA